MAAQAQFHGRHKVPVSKVRCHHSPACDFSRVRPPLSQGMRLQALPESGSLPMVFISYDSSTVSLSWNLCFIQIHIKKFSFPCSLIASGVLLASHQAIC